MKRIIYILIAIFLMMNLLSCKKEDKNLVEEEKKEVEEEIVEEVDGQVPQEEGEIEEVEGVPSPLSGIYAPEEKVNRRVVAVMFDNHPNARWQAGLKDAEIIYEFPVEAPYTRYLGLYLINDPEALGSIRSARPYFVTVALEYDAVYVRAGGSKQAKEDVRKLKMADIDSLSSSSKVFWRNKSKRMPHNLYTNMEVIRQEQERRGYRLEGNIPRIPFNKEDKDLVGYDANHILLRYNKNNTTEYIYDQELKLYLRKKDGKNHIDELDNTQLYAKNIIVQKVNTRIIDKEGRLDIDLIGQGEGLYFTNGKGILIKWVKESRQDKTRYYTEDGQELQLNPGVSWIQMVSPSVDIAVD